MTPVPSTSTVISTTELRRRGALPLAALLAAGIVALAWLGRSTDPAAKALPTGPLTLGGAIAFTGNANLYGQDQRQGLAVAERWAKESGQPRGPCGCSWRTVPRMSPAPSPPSTC